MSMVTHDRPVRFLLTLLAVIVGWPCTLFLFLDLVLLIVAGLRFRKAARERRASAAHGGEFISDTKEAGSHHETSA